MGAPSASTPARRLPIVDLWHSAGARIDEGVFSLDAMGRIFRAITCASGRIPQVSVLLGPAAGAAAYGPALTDVVIMAPEAYLFVTGPDVVASVTGEHATMNDLGGREVHTRRSGVCHLAAASAEAAIEDARAVIDLLGRPGVSAPVDDRDLGRHLPARVVRAYDMRLIVHDLLDTPGVELQPDWGPDMLTVLGRIGGRSVGVVANNPLRLGGCLDSRSAEKAARFVRTCDAFGVPIACLVDVPGYLPGVRQETDGVVRRGAKLLHAFAGCTVPRVSVIVRKAFGGAYIAMNARSLGADLTLAWPDAQVAVMGAQAAVRVLHRRQLEAAPTPNARRQVEADLVAEHLRAGAEAGVGTMIDRVIAPQATRGVVGEWLAEYACYTSAIRGTRANIPL